MAVSYSLMIMIIVRLQTIDFMTGKRSIITAFNLIVVNLLRWFTTAVYFYRDSFIGYVIYGFQTECFFSRKIYYLLLLLICFAFIEMECRFSISLTVYPATVY